MTPTEKYNLIEKARDFASQAHAGQTRRDRRTPYFNHVADVARRLSAKGADATTIAVGYLHDVIEDTTTTLANLVDARFPFEVTSAVWILTKMHKWEYEAYLAHVKANPIARAVKIQDMLSNLSDDPTDAQVLKYVKGLAYLLT